MDCVKRAVGIAEAIGRPVASEPGAREPPGLREPLQSWHNSG